MSVYHTENNNVKFQNTSKFKQSENTTNHSQYSFKSESSTKLKEEFKPEVAEWRRAIPEDQNAIRKLKTLTGDIAKLLFQRQNISELLETTYFPVVQFDTKGSLVSFTAFDSFPNLQEMPFTWEDWLTYKYRLKGVATGNVVFIQYMIWHPDYEEKFLPLLLETLFTEFALIDQIMIVRPPNIELPEFLSKYFIPVLPYGLESLEISSVQLLLVCLRTTIVQPLYIRIAFEQEFKFILSVLSDNFKAAKENSTTYWGLLNDFYQKHKKTLICELDGEMVGVMILNLKMDLDFLNEWFELAPFNGLKKKNLDKRDTDNESFTTHDPFYSREHKEPNLLISSEHLFSHMNWEMMLNKVQPNGSFFSERNSSSSSKDSEFSQVSIFRLSSYYDLDESSASSYEERNGAFFKIGPLNLMMRTSESTTTHFFPPQYHGDTNAFAIEFFAIDCNKVDEKLSSFDFLKAAFRIIPDKDYCALLLPTELIPFPLMDSFVRVTPRPTSNFKQELYVCHKNSLSVLSISVRTTERNDLASIKYFLKNVDEGDTVYQDILENCFENNNFKSFVLTYKETIVGVSLLNSKLGNENFYKYFEVAEIRYSSLTETEKCSVIQHLVINPLYHIHARFFVRDIMRLEAVNCLYYVYNKPCKNRPRLLTVFGELAPIKPKKKVGFTDPFSKISRRDEHEGCISLYFLSPRLCGFHKIHINIVIVVIGTSRTALSFLESLIFGPESCLFNYNNIICVTSTSCGTSKTDKDLRNLMFVNYDGFSANYASMLSLETYVNFIYGVMTKINRSEKYIVVNNKAIVKYDYLILTCGLQYSTPIPESKKIFQKGTCRNNFTSSLSRFLPQKFTADKKKFFLPKQLNNLFIINTNNDARNALRILHILVQNLKKTGDKKIILYGHDLHVFLTIHTLLKLGIPGEIIVFVEPFPKGTTTLFNDPAIDQAVLESIKKLNVNYYTNYILYDWSVSPDDYITTIKFHSICKELVLPCLAFFPFVEKLVSEVNFNVCKDARLVYDGRLVINHNFRTNDKYIYAAGPFTKYSRRYFANEYNHQFYNSREVGQKLAEIIKDIIFPQNEKNKPKKEDSCMVPELKAPIVIHCQLPGDFNLFMLRKPGKEIDLETAYNFFDYGQVLTTGDCKMTNGIGYFRLHLNPEGFVESITCFSKNDIDYENLSTLYGLHERLLNNLLYRFDMALIPDFFAYFRQPWAAALFHDDFSLLREQNFKTFFKKIYENKNFYEKVTEELKANNWESLPESSLEELEFKYLNSRMAEDIKNNLLQFLEYNKKDWPMYAISKTIKYKINDQLRP